MCGIYGLFKPSGPLPEEAPQWAAAMGAAVAHRGPDGAGSVTRLGGRCILGHRRLSIIDVDGGAQPMSNEDDTVWVTFNGEIYNYVELRRDLGERGHDFRTASDTEVLVHLYEERGTAMVDDLEGMFAFTILDEKRRRLFLVRDRVGEKPLYYTSVDGGTTWAFASELKALRVLPGLDQSPDVAGIAQFLTLRYIPAPRTHFRGVRKLRPAEAMTLGADGREKSWRYWTVRFSADNALSRDQSIHQVRDRLRQSVRKRLRSDVALGAFLSGGIDSSLVVCAVRDLLPEQDFTTYTVAFDTPALDESKFARLVAERLGTDHRQTTVSSAELLGDFDALVCHYDEPFADASMFPTQVICRLAREDVKVMLSGDGGDEPFGGYREHFQYYRWNRLRRTPGMNGLAQLLSARWPRSWRGAGLLGFLRNTDSGLLDGDPRWGLSVAVLRKEFQKEAEEAHREIQSLVARHAPLRHPKSMMEVQLTDLYLPEQIMVKVDRTSMRAGLESRAPFLDHRLLEFASSLPVRDNFRRGLGKALLREALPEWVPDAIRWRGKSGFTPPLAEWLRDELRERMEWALYDPPPELVPIADPQPFAKLFEAHRAGEDRSDLLFRWLVLAVRFEADARAVRDGGR